MKEYDVYQVDAFTTEKFRGNPAGVVPDASGLSEQEMKMIARELNNSETAFILPPEGPDHELRIRYFTPVTEVPVCGHATVSAHYVRAVEKQLPPGRVFHKIGIGILPVDIVKEEDYVIWMTQGTVEFSEPMAGPEQRRLIEALGLSEDDLHPGCPIQIVSTGHSKVMIGIRSRQKLNSLIPDMSALSRLSADIGCNGFFVFTFAEAGEPVLTYGRMFAPAIGIAEDPVTGNANGPLGAYMVKHGLAMHDGKTFSFTGAQGEAVGRFGKVEVSVAIEGGVPVQVRIGGRAVIVFKTRITI